MRQIEADGFWHDTDGKLATFDTDLIQKINSIIVRKDILDTFLEQTGLQLVWLVDAEKEIHNRIQDFIRACTLRGWIVNELDIQSQVQIFNANQEEIEFD